MPVPRRLLNPFRELETIERDFDRMMRRAFGDVFVFPELYAASGVEADYVPRLDLYRDGNDLVARLELPGVGSSDIDISVTDRVLTVKGKREFSKEMEEKGRYYCMEHHYGTFERSFVVPEGTTVEGIRAEHANGILTITIPGAAEKIEARKVKIPIEVGEKKSIETPSTETPMTEKPTAETSDVPEQS